jgi:hypothetical protein
MSRKQAVENRTVPWQSAGPGLFLLVLGLVLGVQFWRSFHPAWVQFANDGPLGAMMAERTRVPATFTGAWGDLNGYGNRELGAMPNITFALYWLLGPLGFAKFYPLLTLLIFGTSCWFFIRQLGLGPMASLLGGLAAALTPDFFCDACWGTGSHLLCYGSNYVALGLVVSRRAIPSWVRYPLAGMAVGMGVMEGADIGAIFSVFTALFVVFHALVTTDRPAIGVVLGGARVLAVAVFAGLIAAASLSSLIGTQIQGVVGTQQDEQTRQAQWDKATWGSLPKSDLPGLIVPGLFGYRMMGFDEGQPPEQTYWGRAGRDAAWDRYFASGKQGQPPQGPIRWGSGGGYVGVFVFITACWALLQSFRKENSVFKGTEKKLVWFWAAIAAVALLLSFGRYAPFYQLVYALPYASAVRIPGKFMHVFDWSLLVMFAYGLSGLARRMEPSAPAARDVFSQWQVWWSKAGTFDKRWVKISWLAFAACGVGWILYSGHRTWLVNYLQEVYFEAGHAEIIARFSIKQAGIFLVLLAVALGLFTLLLSGYFAGRRATIGMLMIGLFLFVDLSRVGNRWVAAYNWKDRYLKAADNEVIRFLREHSRQGRVASLPAPTNDSNWVFRKEWLEHIFQYYNIQSLDIIQMPRVPEDVAAFERALGYDGNPANLYKIGRRWQLTNTRYLIGPVAAHSELNNKVDPERHRFQPRIIFELQPISERGPALVYTNSLRRDRLQFALFEFTGALPRAKLYTDWQVSTNDQATLQILARKEFDPSQTVLVAEPLPAPKAGSATNANGGTVDYISYAPKHIVLRAKAPSPCVLLLNDKHDPSWKVVVDGKPGTLLRCNYLMRGVFLEPGEHRVEFHFQPPANALYVSLSAIALGLLLLGIVVFGRAKTAGQPTAT